MAKKTSFTEEQKEILNKNQYVESVDNTRITYTEEFKSFYVKNYLSGKKPTEIFILAGFDPAMLGNKRIERASARWRKLYADGALVVDTSDINVEKETVATTPVKKRRGRPRKNPVETVEKEVKAEEIKTVENTEVVQTAIEEREQTAPKKRRGRPRKNPVQNDEEKTIKPKRARKKRVNKIALMAKNMANSETKEVVVDSELTTRNVDKTTAKEHKQTENVQAPKKRRGRPRKNPIAEEVTVAKSEKTVQPVKKRRGRPRKNSVVNEEITVKTVKEPVVTVKNEVQVKAEEQKIITKAPTAENLVESLVDAINKLVKEVNSLKRQIAGTRKNHR